jgi:antibiotic biosynthesis monooxygenase (ABM) superfamily enzyme
LGIPQANTLAPATPDSALEVHPAPDAPTPDLAASAAQPQPSAHLRVAATWLVMALQASAVSLLLKPFAGDLPGPVPALITVTIIVPLGVYVTVPFTMRQFMRLTSRRRVTVKRFARLASRR